MKTLSLSAGPVAGSALALCLLSTAVTPAAADTNLEAHWRFNQVSGPIIDSYVPKHGEDLTSPRRNDGWIGYSKGVADDSAVVRTGSSLEFSGERSSIVFIDDAFHTDFNPGKGSLKINARFKLDPSVLSAAALGATETWNVAQKGRFFNTRGQWKMQILKARNNAIYLHCLVNDDRADTPAQSARVKIASSWISAGRILTANCTLDRNAHELRVDIQNKSSGIMPRSVTSVLTPNFGAVAPRAGACGTRDAFGGHVTIGNKPLCPGDQYDTDDAFRGKIYKVRIYR